ncbi:MAG: hypothetical protein U0175_25595 [Caldilineaceae bacterium]
MASETLTHQVTAALRCVDGNSGRTIASAQISASGIQFVRNRSGDFVLVDSPNVPQLIVVADDRAGEYLPRRYMLTLPRDPNPANAATANSLFQAAQVVMYPTATSPVTSGWAIVRVTVVNATTNAPLPGALVRLVQTDGNRLLARGVSDWRGRAIGEALIAAPNVPAITFGPANGGDDGAVLVDTIAASVEAFFDPQAIISDAHPPDPDDLEQRRAQLPTAAVAVIISAGKSVAVKIGVTLP